MRFYLESFCKLVRSAEEIVESEADWVTNYDLISSHLIEGKITALLKVLNSSTFSSSFLSHSLSLSGITDHELLDSESAVKYYVSEVKKEG